MKSTKVFSLHMVSFHGNQDARDIRNSLSGPDRLFADGIGRLKIGTVVAIEPSEKSDGGHVRLHNGEVIPYDILVFAQGSVWEGPLNLPRHKKDINEHLRSWRSDIQDAKHIVLAGGGAVGVGQLMPYSLMIGH
jgi:NADH dehydrogenase FAD-containing subunit